MNGLSVVSVNGTHHAILLVGDLSTAELAQLSRSVSMPLARRLEVWLAPGRGSLASLRFESLFQSLTVNAMDWPVSVNGLEQ
jgi:hypothetical protein